jgi:hypothetical protein
VFVETETAMYLLDVRAGTLQRHPRPEPIRMPEYSHLPPAAVADLRRDGEDIPYTLLAPLEEGKPARFMLQLRDDGVSTLRTTTNVIGIHATEDYER